MAKRYNEEDDDLDLDLDFDREEYMHKEIDKGKSTLIAVGLAPFFAFVTMYVFTLTEVWQISLVAGMLGLIFLKPIYDYLDIDLDKIGKKGWVKNGGVYFMTLLAVWVILMNPPISDFADPQIDDVAIEVNHQGEWKSPDQIENITENAPYEIRVVANVTDNDEVDPSSVMIKFEGGDWENMNKTEDYIYEYRPEGEFETGTYNIKIKVEDVNGNRNSVNVDRNIKAQEEE
ncbi:MAG: hypothetical protein ACLFSM_01945 [Thermoplasmata archaeon]